MAANVPGLDLIREECRITAIPRPPPLGLFIDSAVTQQRSSAPAPSATAVARELSAEKARERIDEGSDIRTPEAVTALERFEEPRQEIGAGRS